MVPPFLTSEIDDLFSHRPQKWCHHSSDYRQRSHPSGDRLSGVVRNSAANKIFKFSLGVAPAMVSVTRGRPTSSDATVHCSNVPVRAAHWGTTVHIIAVLFVCVHCGVADPVFVRCAVYCLQRRRPAGAPIDTQPMNNDVLLLAMAVYSARANRWLWAWPSAVSHTTVYWQSAIVGRNVSATFWSAGKLRRPYRLYSANGGEWRLTSTGVLCYMLTAWVVPLVVACVRQAAVRKTSWHFVRVNVRDKKIRHSPAVTGHVTD